MKRRLIALLAGVSVFAAAPALTPVPTGSLLSAAPALARTCGGGYTHADLPWGEKCLRRGQFCKHRGDRAYHRYGFHCHHADDRGNYHLS